jgi:signal transduction histidine kinase
VLAPVLREAVTNVLRHSAAKTCTIEATAGEGLLRLRVCNNGVTGPPSAGQAADGDCAGRGLANLTARMQAVRGRLTSRCKDGEFDMIAELPVTGPRDASPAADGGPVAGYGAVS